MDMLALQPDVANADDQVMPYIYLNNAMVLAKYFDKRENMKKCPRTLDKVPGDIYYVDIVCSKTGRICPNVYR